MLDFVLLRISIEKGIFYTVYEKYFYVSKKEKKKVPLCLFCFSKKLSVFFNVEIFTSLVSRKQLELVC